MVVEDKLAKRGLEVLAIKEKEQFGWEQVESMINLLLTNTI